MKMEPLHLHLFEIYSPKKKKTDAIKDRKENIKEDLILNSVLIQKTSVPQ